MSFRLLGNIELAENLKPGRFDHAAIHRASGRLYVAHPANDALDVIDCVNDRYLHSIPNLSDCDAGQLVILETDSGAALKQLHLSGSPDVIFFNRVFRHLYVAIGDPGVVDVFDTDVMERIETVQTERGAHTLAFDAERNRSMPFCPKPIVQPSTSIKVSRFALPGHATTPQEPEKGKTACSSLKIRIRPAIL
jgi:hypothetical protein